MATTWPIQQLNLNPPPLDDLAECISTGLQKNFKDVHVEVTECPDLRQAPFNLAGAGLCGNPRIADVGGQPNLAPSPKLDKIYSLFDIANSMEMLGERGFLLGAAAGPFTFVGMNSELMPNLSYDDDKVTNRTHYAKVQDDGRCLCAKLPSGECGLMANLFGSAGLPGPVLKVVASVRTGELNFTTAIRNAIAAKFGDKTVSVGGVFLIRKGKAKLHVMPDFSKTPLVTPEEKENWLRYYTMEAPLVCLSVFHSYDPGLDLRIEHTHCFSEHGEGGHYHYDVTPEEIEYEAYFNVADVQRGVSISDNGIVLLLSLQEAF